MSNLEGRMARCQCGKTAPSTDDGSLAFFEYRGPESEVAKKSCVHCRYYDVAHNPPASQKVCLSFEAGPYPYDSFYCGCRGWD